MKYITLFAVLALVFACGGGAESPPPAAAPAPAGPGVATAPDGVAIAYTVSGHGSPALVFIHGWMCDQSYWAAQVPAFSETNTVVTVDLAGHGASGMEREGWPLMAFGADVQAVVEHLDLDDVVLIGHSMGAPVALEAARLMPQRVIGVVAVDSLHDADLRYDPEQFAGFVAAMESDFPAACGGFVGSMFPEGADAALIERITNDMCSGPPEVGVALMRQFVDYDMGAALAAVDVPVRCINADAIATNIKGNRAYHADFDAVIIDGVGHFLMMERPEEFNEKLRQVVVSLDQPPVERS